MPEFDLALPAATTEALWFLPIHGDGCCPASEIGALHLAELAFPKLLLKEMTGTDRGPAGNARPFGEVIADVVTASHRRSAAAAG